MFAHPSILSPSSSSYSFSPSISSFSPFPLSFTNNSGNLPSFRNVQYSHGSSNIFNCKSLVNVNLESSLKGTVSQHCVTFFPDINTSGILYHTVCWSILAFSVDICMCKNSRCWWRHWVRLCSVIDTMEFSSFSDTAESDTQSQNIFFCNVFTKFSIPFFSWLKLVWTPDLWVKHLFVLRFKNVRKPEFVWLWKVNDTAEPNFVHGVNNSVELDFVVPMTQQSLTLRFQWHCRVWLCGFNDTAESDYAVSMTLQSPTLRFQWHCRVRLCGFNGTADFFLHMPIISTKFKLL